MTHSFDKDYWERHWEQAPDAALEDAESSAPNPHLIRAASGLEPSTALDAGCGTGTEATWLAAHGWQVTGADISGAALAQASERAEQAVRVRQGDLGRGGPDLLGARMPIRPCDHQLRAPGDAATGLLRTHLGMGGSRGHIVDRRAPAARRLCGTRASLPPRRPPLSRTSFGASTLLNGLSRVRRR